MLWSISMLTVQQGVMIQHFVISTVSSQALARTKVVTFLTTKFLQQQKQQMLSTFYLPSSPIV
jgi:hypothetical protein